MTDIRPDQVRPDCHWEFPGQRWCDGCKRRRFPRAWSKDGRCRFCVMRERRKENNVKPARGSLTAQGRVFCSPDYEFDGTVEYWDLSQNLIACSDKDLAAWFLDLHLARLNLRYAGFDVGERDDAGIRMVLEEIMEFLDDE